MALVTDRQWLDPTNGLPLTVGGKTIEAFLAYHGGPITTVGQYVQGIDEDGNVIAQPGIGQIPNVSQSGPIRVDSTPGPGRGWIYQSFYNSASGVHVATAPAAQYQDRNAWETNDVSPMIPVLMPWLQLDGRGNAYVSWATDGTPWLSISPIKDPRNDPGAGGRPGTFWSKPVRISPPSVKSAVFVMNVAGDAGRVAIAYLGSEDCDTAGAETVKSDLCQLEAHWQTHISVIDDALALTRGEQAAVHTGVVSKRIAHRGSVCTAGTTCTGDRSLLDLHDLGFDEDGRIGVVTMDNNNRLAAPNLTDNAKKGPFTIFAKQVKGASLRKSKPTVAIMARLDSTSDPAGDATWPNTAAGRNRASLDLLGARVAVVGNDLVATVPLADASKTKMLSDLGKYNSAFATDLEAARLQYIVRFETPDDVFHLSMEQNADGSRRFFGGRLDANDVVTNGAGSTVGARYVTDAGYPVQGSVSGNTLVLRAPLSAFGLALGSRLYRVAAFATAAPAEDDDTATVMQNPARTLDATPPFDAKLKAGTVPDSLIDCQDSRVVRRGGWHEVLHPQANHGLVCRVIAKNGTTQTMALSFKGEGIDILIAKGPRGNTFSASVDGGPAVKVDEYRPPTDPANPDTTGRKDLTFGKRIHVDAFGNGVHTVRIVVDPPKPASGGSLPRDMVYIDAFEVVAGDAVAPPPGTLSDVSYFVRRDVSGPGLETFAMVLQAASPAVEVIAEIGGEGSEFIAEVGGEIVSETARTVNGVATTAGVPLAAGAYLVNVDFEGTGETSEFVWELILEGR